MLACGSSWKPRRARRIIEAFSSSCLPFLVETDDGNAYVKCIGNPQGEVSLCTELVAAELASWFGLRIPKFAIIDFSLNVENARIQHGPAFASQKIHQAFTGFDAKTIRAVANKSDIAKLVVFDTWIRNFDRFSSVAVSKDNLLFQVSGRKREMIIIDHSCCFTDGSINVAINSDGPVQDMAIYGNFPEFRPHITEVHVREAVNKLSGFDLGLAAQIVATVPQEWGLSSGERDAWADMIYRRAMFVSDALPPQLIPQISLF